MLWFTDLRKTALLALITSVLSAVYPGLNASRTMMTSVALIPWYFGILAIVLSFLVIAIPFVFLFVLYRSDATLRISKHLRHLAFVAAVVSGIEGVPYLFTWIRSLLHDPRAIGIINGALGWLSAVAYILFLIFEVRDAEESGYHSRALR